MESRKVVQVLFDAYVPVNGRSSLQQLVSGQQVVSIFRTGDEVGFETFATYGMAAGQHIVRCLEPM